MNIGSMNIPRPEFPGPQLVRDTWMNPVDNGWGYGTAPKTEEEFAERYSGLTSVLLEHPRICGFCYTQLTDVEQEQNGLYNYDRTAKVPEGMLKAIFGKSPEWAK